MMNPHDRGQPAAPAALLREFDSICDRFERLWKSGESPDAAEFAAGVTDASWRPELLRQLLEVEFEQRLRRGESLDPRDYAGRFPELGDWPAARIVALASDEALRDHPPHRNASEPRPDESEDLAIGRLFGKYEILGRLGAGGMGTVYRARHSMIDCQRALKLLRPNLARDPEAVRRFLVEAQTSIELVHPNIVTTYDVDQDTDGTVYIVMELVEGENLHELVSRAGPLEFADAAEIIQQAAAGLAEAHRRGTIHRDIKPHNIMWTSAGVARILDLGLARILDETADAVERDDDSTAVDAMVSRFQSRLTHREAIIGTLPYMSPEQAADARGAGPQSDLYSLGCTFYYLLSGHHAFAGDTVEAIVERHLSGDATPLVDHRPDLPSALERIVARLIERRRENRYQTADAVEEALADWLGHGRDPKPARPLDLDNPASLRDALVELRIIAPDAWDAAATTAARAPAEEHGPSSTSMRVLRELATPRPESGEFPALSEFQLNHVLRGNPDFLRLPHHVLLDQVGSGWKGAVYRARNLESDRIEVVRTFPPRALEGLAGEGRQRISAFHQAVERLRAVQHPSLPQVLESGRFDHRLHGELVYFASEFVEGDTLAAIAGKRKRPNGQPLDPVWSVRAIRDVCRTLEHAHRAGVWHLDVHALNVKADASDRVWLLDLGVAELVTRRHEFIARRSMAMRWSRYADEIPSVRALAGFGAVEAPEPPPFGTMHVMPPEQWQNRSHVSAATDIYNLGCTLFFLTAGHYPFQGSGALELMDQHLHQSPLKSRHASNLPKGLHAVLEKALAKKPSDRFSSGREMGDVLDALVHDPKQLASPTTGWLQRILRTIISRDG